MRSLPGLTPAISGPRITAYPELHIANVFDCRLNNDLIAVSLDGRWAELVGLQHRPEVDRAAIVVPDERSALDSELARAFVLGEHVGVSATGYMAVNAIRPMDRRIVNIPAHDL